MPHGYGSSKPPKPPPPLKDQEVTAAAACQQVTAVAACQQATAAAACQQVMAVEVEVCGSEGATTTIHLKPPAPPPAPLPALQTTTRTCMQSSPAPRSSRCCRQQTCTACTPVSALLHLTALSTRPVHHPLQPRRRPPRPRPLLQPV